MWLLIDKNDIKEHVNQTRKVKATLTSCCSVLSAVPFMELHADPFVVVLALAKQGEQDRYPHE